MKKKTTPREIALLVVLSCLVIGVCYIKFIYQPINEKIAAFESERSVEQSLVDQYLISSLKMDQMQAVVDEVKGNGGGNPIPVYNNSTALMRELYSILNPTEQYSLTFSSVKITDGSYIVDRPVQMSFSAGTYQEAREILNNIENSQFVNQISDINISFPTYYDADGNVTDVLNSDQGEGDGSDVFISLTVTFYEILED